jgi:tRNA 2-selenouridine synthase SelU
MFTHANQANFFTLINTIIGFCSKNLEVKFPVTTDVSSLPENVAEMEEQVKRKNWEKEMVLEDMKREEDLLKQVKELYRKQKQELMDYVTQPAVTQVCIREQFIHFRT